MSIKFIFRSWKDVEMIIENCPITIAHNYSYGIHLQVAIMVYKLRRRCRVIYLVDVCLYFPLCAITRATTRTTGLVPADTR